MTHTGLMQNNVNRTHVLRHHYVMVIIMHLAPLIRVLVPHKWFPFHAIINAQTIFVSIFTFIWLFFTPPPFTCILPFSLALLFFCSLLYSCWGTEKYEKNTKGRNLFVACFADTAGPFCTYRLGVREVPDVPADLSFPLISLSPSTLQFAFDIL